MAPLWMDAISPSTSHVLVKKAAAAAVVVVVVAVVVPDANSAAVAAAVAAKSPKVFLDLLQEARLTPGLFFSVNRCEWLLDGGKPIRESGGGRFANKERGRDGRNLRPEPVGH